MNVEDIKKILAGNLDANKIKLMVATPCFGGKLDLPYVQSAETLVRLFSALGIRVGFEYVATESLITRARNFLTAKFLASDYTHLAFIDADIGYDPLNLLRILSADLDVVGQAYPLKTYDFKKIIDEVNAGTKDPELLKIRAINHVVNFTRSSEDELSSLNITKGSFVEVAHAGTGFMVIKRSVLEKMKEKYTETYINDVNGYDNSLVYNTFFDTVIDEKTRRYLSEDFAFCKKWREIGGKVHIELLSTVSHTGTHTFYGNLIESFPDPIRTTVKEYFTPKNQTKAPFMGSADDFEEAEKSPVTKDRPSESTTSSTKKGKGKDI